MKARKWTRIGCAGTIVTALAACGGGGGSNSPPPPPPPPTFTVGGTVSGAAGSVVLVNNGGGNLTVNANGTFTFASSLSTGATYNVTVLTPPGLQACTVANGSGTVSANVTNITVACTDVPPPTLALTLAKTKLFRFAWNSAAGSTHYRLREDPTGSSGFTQLGADIPASSTSIEQMTTLYSRLNARYIVQACAASRCIDSNTVSVTGSLVEAIGYFKASNSRADAQFGIAVALSTDGKTLAVGANGESSSATGIDGDQSNITAADAGAVYVFVRTGNVWSQQAYVKASNTGAGDSFGNAVALSADGSILAVGAEGEDSNARNVDGNETNGSAENSGAVYVFGRAGTAWSRQAYIKSFHTETLDQFGHSVALSGDGRTLAIGATGEDSNATGIDRDLDIDPPSDSASNSGAVYVFARPADTWARQAYVKASNTGLGDLFGDSVALSADGSTLAVGAVGEDSGATGPNGNQGSESAPESGAVYVFGRVAAVWSPQGYLKASDTAEGDAFGGAVAVSADGSTLAVGAADEAALSGAVYVFARLPSNVWTGPEAQLKASNAQAEDLFGFSVALSADGQILAVGALGEDGGLPGIGGDETDNSRRLAGAAYVFTRSGAAWSQQSYVKASNAQTNGGPQRFREVALSGDGTILAVGAFAEDGADSGINGDELLITPGSDSGAVYLY